MDPALLFLTSVQFPLQIIAYIEAQIDKVI